MTKIQLNKPPLIEAIFEMYWGRQGEVDQSYPLIVGRLYEGLKSKYPFPENLPTAEMPPAAAMHIARHRFRSAPNSWPLAQIGPGVLTYNETEKYVWANFQKETVNLLNVFYECYPQPSNFVPVRYLLRYLSAIEYDPSLNLRSFIESHFKINQHIQDSVLSGLPINLNPLKLESHHSFRVQAPSGILSITLNQGLKDGKPSILLDILFQSDAINGMPKGFEEWLSGAHQIVEDLFFKMIDGPLLEKFK